MSKDETFTKTTEDDSLPSPLFGGAYLLVLQTLLPKVE